MGTVLFLTVFLVSVPVTDLRREPIERVVVHSHAGARGSENFEHDPLQESQLLYGEKVIILEQRDAWSRVEAVEQVEWTHNEKWEGYPGWVRSEHLIEVDETGWKPNAVITVPIAEVYQGPSEESHRLLELFIGTRIVVLPFLNGWQSILLVDGRTGWIHKDQLESLESLPQVSPSQLRKQIISSARTFLGKPYFWGGLSQAVDCSGLTHLAYRANGIDLPRDAHEQFMKSRPLDRSQLEPADLIFFGSEENPDRISHVMLYAGDGKIVEGPGTGKFVHEISLEEKLNQNQNRKVYFGSYLH